MSWRYLLNRYFGSSLAGWLGFDWIDLPWLNLAWLDWGFISCLNWNLRGRNSPPNRHEWTVLSCCDTWLRLIGWCLTCRDRFAGLVRLGRRVQQRDYTLRRIFDIQTMIITMIHCCIVGVLQSISMRIVDFRNFNRAIHFIRHWLSFSLINNTISICHFCVKNILFAVIKCIL